MMTAEDQDHCREHAQPRNSRNASISTISRDRARCAAGDFCFPWRRRRWPFCGSRGMAYAATAACTPPETCPPRTRFSRGNVPPATCPTWVFTTPRSSTRSASRAMTAPCTTPRRRSRPHALPATPIIGERFGWPPRATQIAPSVMRISRRAEIPPILYATSGVLKIITPSSLCCDPSAVIREAFNSIIISICSRIFSDRVAAACRWRVLTVIARRRTPAARGLMRIQKARPALRKIHH